MKLSKKGLLVISIGILIIGLAGLWMVRSQQVSEQKQLEEKLNLAELKLNGIKLEKLSQRQEELGQQLDETTLQSEDAKSILSQPIDNIAIGDIVFDIAAANTVNVTDLSSSGFASEELAGITCAVLPVTVGVEGSLSDIAGFITRLNGDLENALIKSVEISVPETTDEKTSANIQMVIYTYQGGG